MKKLLFAFLISIVSFPLFSQNRIISDHPMMNVGVERQFYQFHDAPIAPSQKINPTVSDCKNSNDYEEHQIGTSWYDLQTNSLTQNRIYKFDDGTISSVWTMGLNPTNFEERGTGYNYFDGTSWGSEPVERIESDRTGWPSIAPYGENGEIICAHISGGNSDGLLINKRVNKGTGDWEESLLSGPAGHEILLWPRMITSGVNHDHIHIIALTAPEGNGGTPYLGQDGALLYWRSTDGGETWDIEGQLIDGLGGDYYTQIRGDNYMWAESKNGVLAFMVAETWMDVVLMKSNDNGDTWEKTVVWENPYPMFDWDLTITDTFYCPDNSGGLALDPDGMAHMVFGISRVGHFEIGTSYTYFPYTDGIAYWNENMEPFYDPYDPDEALNPYTNLIEGHNLIGYMQDVDGDDEITLLEEIYSYRELGLSTMPDIAIDDDYHIDLIYASTTETFDDGTHNFKHIWARTSPDNGTTWGNTLWDMNIELIHIFDECIFPVIVDVEHGYGFGIDVEFQYNIDSSPGLAWSDDHDWQENKIVYLDFVVYPGIDEGFDDKFKVSQNYPNPCNDETAIKVVLSQASDINVNVIALTGQTVFEKKMYNAYSGNHIIKLNVAELPSGIYFYTVKANEQIITHKMIIE